MDYGKISFEGKEYTTLGQSELTNRVFPNWWGDVANGETYISEWSASAVDDEGKEYRVGWQFEEVRGEEREPDSLDWDDVYEVQAL